jgi:hypothetical protein
MFGDRKAHLMLTIIRLEYKNSIGGDFSRGDNRWLEKKKLTCWRRESPGGDRKMLWFEKRKLTFGHC